MNNSWPPEQEELLAQIGLTLLLLQDLEHIFSHCMRLIFGDKSMLSLKDFLSPEKRTLGKMKHELGLAVTLDDDFDDFLKTLIRNRNLFVHHLREQTWFNIETEQGQNSTYRFLIELFHQIESATKIFQAFALKQAKQYNMQEVPYGNELRERGIFQDLEENYIPYIDSLIKGKK